MKILFPVSTFYPVQKGGPNFTLLWHCKELVKNNINVTIISTDTGFDLIKGELPPVNVFKPTDMGNIIYLSGRFKFLRQLYNVYLNLDKVDAIHFNSFFSPICFVSFLLIKLLKKKIKIIWSPRGEMNINALKFTSIKKKCILFIIKPLIRKVTFHSTSDQETTDIQKVLKSNKIFQIGNLINLEKSIITEKSNNFLFMGRIHPIKFIESLIEALGNSLLFINSNYKLMIAGECEERHNYYLNFLKKLIIEKKLENKIKFIGHVKGLEKQTIYAKSIFTFLPSHSENFGNVVVESMSQGTPVVASKGTPWKSLNSLKSGFHVDNDHKTLTKTVDRIINLSDVEYSLYCNNCRNHVKHNFDIKLRIKDWINYYQNFN